MNLAYFLAQRIHFSKASAAERVSPPAISIAITGIAIGLVVMILSVAIVLGFKQEISRKVTDFGGHMQVNALSSSRSLGQTPICVSDSLLSQAWAIGNVKSVARYITKPAVLKTQEDFLAVVIKGIDEVNERAIWVSENIAQKLKLHQGDKINLYFVQGEETIEESRNANIKVRQVKVDSVYASGFNEIDKQMVYGNIGLLQTIAGWDYDMASALEIHLLSTAQSDDSHATALASIEGTTDRRGTALTIKTAEQIYPQIYSWLDLLDTNVWVVLILISIVAAFTMISGLLIIILERTSMIGTLKALGCTNLQLRKVFLWVAMFVVGKGLIIGNIIGIALCWLQHTYHIIALDPENYYIAWVPITLGFTQLLAINLGTIVITLLVLIVPTQLVANISPVKAIASE